MKRFLIVLSAAALIALPAVAEAKHSSNNFWHSGQQWEDSEGHKSKGGDRDVLRSYVLAKYKRHCAPGLAKKNPPCIPPGHAKAYSKGSTLPADSFEWVPRDTAELLTPAPSHARYARLGQNVYLINEGTRKVIEAFELFSAVR